MKRFLFLAATAALIASSSMLFAQNVPVMLERIQGQELALAQNTETAESTATTKVLENTLSVQADPNAWTPAFDAGDDSFLVVDGLPDNLEGRFTIGVQVYNYSTDKTIKAEVYGWGGRFADEWRLINPIRLDRFAPDAHLYHTFYRGIDYTHYRYFAIKITKPKDKKYTIVSDQRNQNLNFYIWDYGASMTLKTDTDSDQALIYNAEPKGYVIDSKEISESINDNIIVTSTIDFADIPVNLYVYSKEKKVLVYYGIIKFGDYMKNNKKSMKKATQMKLEDFRNSHTYDLHLDESGLNMIVMDE